jgi:hypothetical protein
MSGCRRMTRNSRFGHLNICWGTKVVSHPSCSRELSSNGRSLA